ncbi:MAG TPA: hypothetical protein VID26_12305 [Candidatus Limnocylindrales bacterium]|jgi:uncharacterized membrane protein YdfJ with MMPL/SSD domain
MRFSLRPSRAVVASWLLAALIALATAATVFAGGDTGPFPH